MFISSHQLLGDALTRSKFQHFHSSMPMRRSKQTPRQKGSCWDLEISAIKGPEVEGLMVPEVIVTLGVYSCLHLVGTLMIWFYRGTWHFLWQHKISFPHQSCSSPESTPNWPLIPAAWIKRLGQAHHPKQGSCEATENIFWNWQLALFHLFLVYISLYQSKDI